MKFFIKLSLLLLLLNNNQLQADGFYLGLNAGTILSGATFRDDNNKIQRYEYITPITLGFELGYYLSPNMRVGISKFKAVAGNTEVKNKIELVYDQLYLDYLFHQTSGASFYAGVANTTLSWKLRNDNNSFFVEDVENGLAIRLGIIKTLNKNWVLSFNYSFDATIADIEARDKQDTSLGQYTQYGGYHPMRSYTMGLTYKF
jgi:hypothetical protein